MTPHLPTGRPGRSLLLALAALAGLAGTAPAAEAPAGTSDVLLARSAFAALDADPILRDAGLVVSVVDRVAVIGGPVGSTDAGKRAAWVIHKVPGIAEVKNRCFVQSGPDPLLRAVAERTGPRRPFIPELPPIVPGAKAPPAALPPPGAADVAPPFPAERVVGFRPPTDSVLLPPVAPLTAPLIPPAAPRATVPATTTPSAPVKGTPTGRPADVLTAAGTVRTGSPKFAALTVEVRDGTLVIGGAAARTADAWEFAQALRRLPGVSRVAVGAVEVR